MAHTANSPQPSGASAVRGEPDARMPEPTQALAPLATGAIVRDDPQRLPPQWKRVLCSPGLGPGGARHSPSLSEPICLQAIRNALRCGSTSPRAGDIQHDWASVLPFLSPKRRSLVPSSLRASRELICGRHSKVSAVRSIAGIPGTGHHAPRYRVEVVGPCALRAAR